MFSGPEIHISARRRGSFYQKSRAEQAAKAELETLLRRQAVASCTHQHSAQCQSTRLELRTMKGLCHIEQYNMETTYNLTSRVTARLLAAGKGYI